MSDNSLWSRARNAWNAFNNSTTDIYRPYYDGGSSIRPDRPRLSSGSEKTILTAILTRISIDVASIPIRHVRLDEEQRFLEEIEGPLTDCLTISPNLDQTPRALIQDAVMIMLEKGCVAIVPYLTDIDPNDTDGYKILGLVCGEIVRWYPGSVVVKLYNEEKGKYEEIEVPKNRAAIVQNPLYTVMNEGSSTYKRLVRKLNLLDFVDEQSGSGKLDMIIQLPYVIKSDSRRAQAERRRKDIEQQLANSKYGIAYTDGTEKITQLNRSLENNLNAQIESLTSMLYSQLGINTSVLDGTADEQTMLNYNNRTIEPIISALVKEMKRKFLSKTAISQRQSIEFFIDPFRLVPVNNIAEIADKFTRNEIMTKNEFRQIIGMKPSDDPKADMLLNSNISQSDEQMREMMGNTPPSNYEQEGEY